MAAPILDPRLRASRRRSAGLGLVGILGLSGLGCHARHLRLDAPGSSPGQSYVCRDRAEGSECVPADTVDDAMLNPSGLVQVNLPAACRGLVSRVVILDADSDDPEIHVRCGVPRDPIEDPLAGRGTP